MSSAQRERSKTFRARPDGALATLGPAVTGVITRAGGGLTAKARLPTLGKFVDAALGGKAPRWAKTWDAALNVPPADPAVDIRALLAALLGKLMLDLHLCESCYPKKPNAPKLYLNVDMTGDAEETLARLISKSLLVSDMLAHQMTPPRSLSLNRTIGYDDLF